MNPSVSHLGIWDYVTFPVLTLLASGIGIYHAYKAWKSKDVGHFLVKSKEVGILPLALSMAATVHTAISYLGFPTEVYNNGVSFIWLILGFFLVIPIGIKLYLPVIFDLGLSSIFEYLELRFNRRIRLCVSILGNIQVVLVASCSIYAPALALHQVTGLHFWGAVSTIGVTCIIYTSLGGIKAVIWTDVTQILIMTAVPLLLLIKGTADLGGIAEIWKTCKEGKRAQFLVLTESPYSAYSFWSLTMGGVFHAQGYLVMSQPMMQRYLSNSTLKKAQITLVTGTVVSVFIMAMNCVCGLLMYAKYNDCDPLISGKVTSRDQIIAIFAMETLQVLEGLPGVFIAAIMCATLSSLSSHLNSLSTMVMVDCIKPCFPNLSNDTEMKLSKIVAAAYGILCIALVVVIQNVAGLIKLVFSINGAIGGPILALFLMGMTLPWVNNWGAISGFLAGLLLTGWASIGNLVLNPKIPHAPFITSGCNISSEMPLFNQSGFLEPHSTLIAAKNISDAEARSDALSLYASPPIWYACWSCGVGLVVAVIVSILTGPLNPEKVDPKLISSLTRNVCRRLPKKWQRFLGYAQEKCAQPTEKMEDSSNEDKQNKDPLMGETHL